MELAKSKRLRMIGGFLQHKAVVFNIQSYSIHDGPGIRTVVFFKGCPLACAWCSNPESQKRNPEIGIIRERCKLCKACLEICPAHAISIQHGNRLVTDDYLCQYCGKCETICPNQARKLFGREIEVDELIREIRKDGPFYTRSDGGVTISGGEPTLQIEPLGMLLKGCKDNFIHTAIETCGYFTNQQKINDILRYLDLVLYDIKCIDEQKHVQWTGVSNKLILENAHFLASSSAEIIVRVPVVPGFNDSREDIRQLGEFISSLSSVREIELLPYHEWGKSKYEMLEKEYRLTGFPEVKQSRLSEFQSIFESYGLKCLITG